MPRDPRPRPTDARELESITPDLTELCRIHDLSIEMIESSDDLDTLMSRILEEYEKRLSELPSDALDSRSGPASLDGKKKLRALTMFASQAIALKTKAEAAAELRRHAEDVERANDRLKEALEAVESAHRKLDGVLETLEAGILIVDATGRVQQANRAAGLMIGGGTLVGENVSRFLSEVPRMSDGEVVCGEAGHQRVLMITRRDLDPDSASEVVMLRDVTKRYREIEERHRLEKLAGVLRTIRVLSHKINNPLTALLGRAQLLQTRAGTDPAVVKAAAVIEEASKRIGGLAREIAAVVEAEGEEALEKLLDMGPVAPGAEQPES